MLKLLQMLNRNIIIVIPLSMVPGLLFKIPYDPRPLKALMPAFTFLMVFPMMVTLQYRKAFTKCSYLNQGTAQFINFLIVPLIGFGLGRAFFRISQTWPWSLLPRSSSRPRSRPGPHDSLTECFP